VATAILSLGEVTTVTLHRRLSLPTANLEDIKDLTSIIALNGVLNEEV